MISNSYGAASFDISFNLCNSTLNGRALDCTVAANDRDVLSYDATTQTWKPRAVNGLNYLGSFDASSGTAPTAQPSGSYYIISVAGTISGINFEIGDWIVSNGPAYQKIDNSTAITSVFGRTGAVTALEGDYSLDQLLDVQIPAGPIAAGKILLLPKLLSDNSLLFIKWDGKNESYIVTDPLSKIESKVWIVPELVNEPYVKIVLPRRIEP